MAAFTRRQYAGAAAATTITAGINTTDTTCSLAATTGWPSTAGVPFYVVIDPGTSAEEKCSATISGSTLTLTRGQDDTSASSHSSGATIYPVFTANDADEANEIVAKLTTKGDLLVTTGSVLNRLAVGTNDYALLADSSATNGVAWKQVPAAGLASDSVTTAKILNANVTAAKLATDSVETAKIVNLNVTTAKIADGAVTTVKITDANVTAAKLATDSVETAKIADNAVTQAKLADRVVGSAELDNLTLNAQTGTTYTLVLADAHKLVTLSNASAITATVPPNSSVAFEIGDQVNLLQLGAGQVTVAAGSGVTLRSQGSKLKLNGQYSTATLVKIASDEWVLLGNTAA
jgi:hypothetical protein